MKMKELSALTGISDRTIRYYIDDGLFIPEKYTENYEGRRSYEFTENDVKHLKQIALLRKYGFAMDAIRQMINNPFDISDILESHFEESKESIDERSGNILILKSAIQKNPKSIDELCEMLSSPVDKKNATTKRDSKPYSRWRDAKLILRALGIIILWIAVFKLSPDNTALKVLSLSGILIIPLVLDTIAFVLEVTEKRGLITAISIGLRIVMTVVFLFSLYGFYSVWNDSKNIVKDDLLYSSFSAEQLVGLPEDENTVYIVNHNYNDKLTERPEADKASFPSLFNHFGFNESLGMELTQPNKDYSGQLDITLTYCEKPVFQKLLVLLTKHDVKSTFPAIIIIQIGKQMKPKIIINISRIIIEEMKRGLIHITFLSLETNNI